MTKMKEGGAHHHAKDGDEASSLPSLSSPFVCGVAFLLLLGVGAVSLPPSGGGGAPSFQTNT